MVPTTAFYNNSTLKPSWRKTATSLKSQPRPDRFATITVWTPHRNTQTPGQMCLQSPPTSSSSPVSASPVRAGQPPNPVLSFPWLLLHQHQGPCQHKDRGTAPSTLLCPGTEPRVQGPGVPRATEPLLLPRNLLSRTLQKAEFWQQKTWGGFVCKCVDFAFALDRVWKEFAVWTDTHFAVNSKQTWGWACLQSSTKHQNQLQVWEESCLLLGLVTNWSAWDTILTWKKPPLMLAGLFFANRETLCIQSLPVPLKVPVKFLIIMTTGPRVPTVSHFSVSAQQGKDQVLQDSHSH